MEDQIQKVKDYALTRYPKLFKKKVVTRVKGRITNSKVIDLPIIVSDGGNHWRVSNHIDASPLILSKQILIDN